MNRSTRCQFVMLFWLQVEAEGDVATAVTLARILSSIPLSRGGPTSVVIFDIHALQACPKTGPCKHALHACLAGAMPMHCRRVMSDALLSDALLSAPETGADNTFGLECTSLMLLAATCINTT